MSGFVPSRRSVLKGSAAAALSIVGAPILRARPLRSRLVLAAVGTANRAAANIDGISGEDVAYLCDVDAELLARGVAQVEATGRPKPETFSDWRVLLDKVGDKLDGVVVSTPDHTHFAVARAALKRGLPVYVEKPLTHTVAQARELERLAASAGVPTQMGTQIHATDNYRRVVEAIRAGAIGDVHRVDVVCSKSWSNGRFGEPMEVPAGLAWDLWQGPVPARDYSDGIHPWQWRRFWRYGNGTVGDMACHWVDLVHWALDLDRPVAVTVEGPEIHPVGTPDWMVARWRHPAKGDRKQVEVVWYDGGKKPEFCPLDNCHIFHGTEGKLVSTYGSLEVRLDDPEAKWTAPEPTLPSSPGHYAEWLNAIKGTSDVPPLCHFGYAAPLTETILLANVAYRAGGELTWNGATGEASAGKEFLATEEREGWDV